MNKFQSGHWSYHKPVQDARVENISDVSGISKNWNDFTKVLQEVIYTISPNNLAIMNIILRLYSHHIEPSHERKQKICPIAVVGYELIHQLY